MTGGYPPSGPRVPEAEVWTEEMKLFALHISYSTKLDLFIPFLTFLARIRIRIFFADPDPQIYADPDPKPWKKIKFF